MFKNSKLNRIILVYELVAFAAVIVFLWLDEILDLPHVLLGAPGTPINWVESSLETVIVAVLGAVVVILTWKFLSHINYLEGFYYLCSYCKKVHVHGTWVPLDTFLQSYSDIRCSHGLCDDCAQEQYGDLLKSYKLQTRLQANPATVRAGGTVTVRCKVKGITEDDNVGYLWTATGGSILEKRNNAVTWQAPEEPGNYTIYVQVKVLNTIMAYDSVELTVLDNARSKDQPVVSGQKPSPVRVKYTQREGDILYVSWWKNPEQDIVGYHVYCARENARVNKKIITENEYVLTGLEKGDPFIFYVAAVNAAGEESAPNILDHSYSFFAGYPRKEGTVRLYDASIDPSRAGFSFMTGEVVDSAAGEGDIIFYRQQGTPQLRNNGPLNENSVTRAYISDMGVTVDFDEDPPFGSVDQVHPWVVALQNHTYAIFFNDRRTAKVRVREIADSWVDIEWASQPQLT